MGGAFYFAVYGGDSKLQSNLQLALCLIFIVGFEFGPGSLGWPYLAEICHPAAHGLSTLANWFWTLVVGLLFPYLNGQWMPEGWVDLIFVAVSAIGLVYFWINFKETRGLTSEQCKRLFLPKSMTKKDYATFGTEEEIE